MYKIKIFYIYLTTEMAPKKKK